jgi:hypothetical protein
MTTQIDPEKQIKGGILVLEGAQVGDLLTYAGGNTWEPQTPPAVGPGVNFYDEQGDPTEVSFDAGADGTSAYAARRDHKHLLAAHTHEEVSIDTTGWINITSLTTLPTVNNATTLFFSGGGNLTSYFPKGTKIKVEQADGPKYGYVISTSYSSGTYVTILGNSITLGSLTGMLYSYASVAPGFPEWFSFTPLWYSLSGTHPAIENGTLTSSYKMDGSLITYSFYLIFGSSTTSGTGNWYWTLPCPAYYGDVLGPRPIDFIGMARVRRPYVSNYIYEATIASENPDRIYYIIQANQNNDNYNYLNGTTPFTWDQDDFLEVQIQYRI